MAILGFCNLTMVSALLEWLTDPGFGNSVLPKPQTRHGQVNSRYHRRLFQVHVPRVHINLAWAKIRSVVTSHFSF
ncbi:hypothetical protein J3E68DRAFT_406467 [Trichoderma sp. SZMC 28012]